MVLLSIVVIVIAVVNPATVEHRTGSCLTLLLPETGAFNGSLQIAFPVFLVDPRPIQTLAVFRTILPASLSGLHVEDGLQLVTLGSGKVFDSIVQATDLIRQQIALVICK